MSEKMPPCPCEENVLLSTVGYYAIGGRARWFASPRSIRDMTALLDWCRRLEMRVIVTGKGSNMLFSDEDFPGVVVSTGSMCRMFWISEHELFCEAGVENTDVAIELMKAGRTGGEWLFRLPGMIGATVRMNGRCYGREMSGVTNGVVTAGLDGTVRCLGREGVFLGYKETSLMKSPEIVVGVVLEFRESMDPEVIRGVMYGYEKDRETKRQFDYPSCGSAFKNSYAAGRPSGQIFESLGFKGRSVGGAMVSDHHANFIFNTGGAKADDVLRLAGMMRTAAREQAGADLDLEVQCAGSFDAALLEACGVPSVPDGSRPGKAWAGVMGFQESAATSFPRTLMQGPMLDYSAGDRRFPAGIDVEVVQLVPLEEARLHPDRPFIRWTTRDASHTAFPLQPDAPEGAFVDRLWEFSVSELFVGGDDGYLEFEISPGRHWVSLRFDFPRRRTLGHELLSEMAWKGFLTPFAGGDGFGMEFTCALLEPYIRDGLLPLQCCASLGGQRYGLFPWWDEPGTVDFHQPDRFCHVRLA
jgi:UDP-N-acetylmuramate dehydrogenase